MRPRFFRPASLPTSWPCRSDRGTRTSADIASGRGANPFSILAPLTERETGSLAWAATRVKLTRVRRSRSRRKLILFSGGMSRFPHPEEPR